MRRPAMAKQRAAGRHKSFLKGRIYFNNKQSSIDCLIREISEGGARLTFSDSVATPDVVELYIPNKDETYRAKVKWHKGDEMGVAFVRSGVTDASSVSGAATPDLSERVQILEGEVATLRRILNELRAELQQSGAKASSA